MTTTNKSMPTSSTSEVPPDDLIYKISLSGTDMLRLTQWLTPPLLALLLFSSIILIVIILTKFKRLYRLYFSLLCFAVSELYLMTVIGVFTLTGELEGQCGVVNSFEMSAIVLPGYMVLMVTLARLVCVNYPLNYQTFLRMPYQLLYLITVVVLTSPLVILPNMGICYHVFQQVPEELRNKFAPYCRIANTGMRCKVYHNCVLMIGFVIPTISIIACYVSIVISLIRYKKLEKHLKQDQSFVDGRPVSLVEKLNVLRKVGCEAIPWSIPTLLLLHICSVLPWLLALRHPESIRTDETIGYVGVDLLYSGMMICVSVTPSLYIITTPNMKGVLKSWVKINSR